jgi:hypothetical protein
MLCLYAHIFLLAIKMDDVPQSSILKSTIQIVHQDFALLSWSTIVPW